jgi:hypothetical protein
MPVRGGDGLSFRAGPAGSPIAGIPNDRNALDAATEKGFTRLAELLTALGASSSTHAGQTEPTGLWYLDVNL